MRRLLLPALAAALLLPASASAAPQVLAREQAPFTADAASGYLAWSSYDPAEKVFRLRLRDGLGNDVFPAVAPSRTAFDVDLGAGPEDGLTAVYSRCDPGCDLYRYDVATGAERKLEGVSSPRQDEHHPSIEGRRIAFARTYRGKDVLYVGDATGASGSVRQPSGSTRGRIARAEATELAGGRLFFIWAGVGRNEGEETLYRVRGSKALPLFRTESGGANESDLIGLSWRAGKVYFGETNHGSGAGNRFYRMTTGGRHLHEARGSSRYLSAVWTPSGFVTAGSHDGCFFNVSEPPSASRCTLEVTGPISWTRSRKRPLAG
jgi:hypothetical protein